MKRFWAVIAIAALGALAFFVSSPSPVTTSLRGVPRQAVPVRQPVAAAPVQPITATSAPVQSITGSSAPNSGPFQAMTAALDTTGYNVEMRTQGSTMTGSVNPAGHTASAVDIGGGLELDEVVSHNDVFVRANLGPQLDSQVGIEPDVWMKLDPSQISPDNELLIQPDGSDPVDLDGISTGITSMHQTDPQHVTGTIDLTKVTGHTLPNPDEVAKAGTAATAVPFMARADGSGRISEFTVTADAFDPSLSLDVLYTDYGSPGTISVPTTSVPAPASLYSIFNS